MGDVSWRTGRQRGSRQTPLTPGSELSAHRVTGSAHDSETPGIAARSWKASEPQDQGPSPWIFKPQQGTRESFLKPGEPWPCPAGCDGPCGPVGHPEAPRHLLAISSPWGPVTHASSDQHSFWLGLAGSSQRPRQKRPRPRLLPTGCTSHRNTPPKREAVQRRLPGVLTPARRRARQETRAGACPCRSAAVETILPDEELETETKSRRGRQPGGSPQSEPRNGHATRPLHTADKALGRVCPTHMEALVPDARRPAPVSVKHDAAHPHDALLLGHTTAPRRDTRDNTDVRGKRAE